jgi:small subunit ribosomal protein S11
MGVELRKSFSDSELFTAEKGRDAATSAFGTKIEKLSQPKLLAISRPEYGMSRAARRLLAQSSFSAGIRASSNPSRVQCLCSRPFSNMSRRRADKKHAEADSPPSSTFKPIFVKPGPQSPESPTSASETNSSSTLSDLANIFGSNAAQRANGPRDPFLDISRLTSIGGESPVDEERFEEPHHFHVYATKHNTHITLTRPNREPIMSYAAGNIGFRKAARKHYDSAFQLASYVMGRIQEQGINAQIKKLEVSLRGFGAGREAVTKAFLGSEGRFLRGKVVKVSDATRIKFGGTRSKKPRRLG